MQFSKIVQNAILAYFHLPSHACNIPAPEFLRVPGRSGIVHAIVYFGAGFGLLAIMWLIDALLARGKKGIVFFGHSRCGHADCRYCLKLSKMWFTRCAR
jgi:hypothetical protein